MRKFRVGSTGGKVITGGKAREHPTEVGSAPVGYTAPRGEPTSPLRDPVNKQSTNIRDSAGRLL